MIGSSISPLATISTNTWHPCSWSASVTTTCNELYYLLRQRFVNHFTVVCKWSCILMRFFFPSSKPPGQQKVGISNSQYVTKKSSKAAALTYLLRCSISPAMWLGSARSWKTLRLEWSHHGRQHLKNWKTTCLKQNQSCWVSVFVFIYCLDNSKLKDLARVPNECPTSVRTDVQVSARLLSCLGHEV